MKITWIESDGIASDRQPSEPKRKLNEKNGWPVVAKIVSKFSRRSDAGVGDTVERIFSMFGGTQFKWLMDRLGVNCGCEDRKQYLNRVFPYAPKLHHEETN